MKRKILLLSVFFMSIWFFIPNQLYAKGSKPEKEMVYLELTLDNGEYLRIEGISTEVLTPGANFLKTYKFKVPKIALEELDFGSYANKIIGVRLTHETGNVIVGAGFLNKAGILTFTLHHNGSGGYFPKGWF